MGQKNKSTQIFCSQVISLLQMNSWIVAVYYDGFVSVFNTRLVLITHSAAILSTWSSSCFHMHYVKNRPITQQGAVINTIVLQCTTEQYFFTKKLLIQELTRYIRELQLWLCPPLALLPRVPRSSLPMLPQAQFRYLFREHAIGFSITRRYFCRLWIPRTIVSLVKKNKFLYCITKFVKN